MVHQNYRVCIHHIQWTSSVCPYVKTTPIVKVPYLVPVFLTLSPALVVGDVENGQSARAGKLLTKQALTKVQGHFRDHQRSDIGCLHSLTVVGHVMEIRRYVQSLDADKG